MQERREKEGNKMILSVWKKNEIMSKDDSNSTSITDVILITKLVLKNSEKDTKLMVKKFNRKLLNYIHLRKERQKVLDVFNETVLTICALSTDDYEKTIANFLNKANENYNKLASNETPFIFLPKREESSVIVDADEFATECEAIVGAFEYIYTTNKNNLKIMLSHILSFGIPIDILSSELNLIIKMYYISKKSLLCL